MTERICVRLTGWPGWLYPELKLANSAASAALEM